MFVNSVKLVTYSESYTFLSSRYGNLFTFLLSINRNFFLQSSDEKYIQ